MSGVFTDAQINEILRIFKQNAGHRQYIGARYVPIFGRKGEDTILWDNSAPYEPLTIVLYQGNSYTSRQYVPAGIEITNNNFWAETGNFNGQIEQYRQEVLGFDNRIEELENKLTTVDVTSPYMVGTSVFISDDANTILLDAGYTDDELRLRNFLQTKGKTLDAVVLTHFHDDHFGAINALVDYCTNDTDFFIQMAPPIGTQNYTDYISGKNTVDAFCSANGFKVPRTPSENEIVTYGDIKIRFNNTTSSNGTIYETIPGEQSPFNAGVPTLNNYSLICTIDINNIAINYSGDLEAVAQRINANYMTPCDFVFTPHHISQTNGYLPWYMNFKAKKWLGTSAASTYGTNLNLFNSYLVKLIRYNYIDDVVLTHDEPLSLSIINGNYEIKSGESLIEEIKQADSEYIYTGFFYIFPPSYTNDNPHYYYTITLQELVRVCYNVESNPFILSTGDLDNNMQIRQDLLTLFDGATGTVNRTLTFIPGRLLTIKIHSTSAIYYDEIICFSSIDVEKKTGVFFNHSGHYFKHVFDSAIEANNLNLSNYLLADDLAKLKTAYSAWVITSGGATIHMLRQGDSANTITNGNQALSGMAISTAMTTIFRAGFKVDNTITVTRLDLSSNTVTNESILAIGVDF